jgi:hypothetical protein
LGQGDMGSKGCSSLKENKLGFFNSWMGEGRGLVPRGGKMGHGKEEWRRRGGEHQRLWKGMGKR